MSDLEPRARTFPSTPQSIRAVRAFVAEATAGRPGQDDIVLVADELATNAFQHTGGTEFTVTVCSTDDGIMVSVRAAALAATEPHVCSDGVKGRAGGTRGRGMFLVQALAAEWGISTKQHEQEVYAVLAAAPSPCPVA